MNKINSIGNSEQAFRVYVRFGLSRTIPIESLPCELPRKLRKLGLAIVQKIDDVVIAEEINLGNCFLESSQLKN